MVIPVHDTYTGTLNADRLFLVTNRYGATIRGVFATEDGHTIIRNGALQVREFGTSLNECPKQ